MAVLGVSKSAFAQMIWTEILKYLCGMQVQPSASDPEESVSAGSADSRKDALPTWCVVMFTADLLVSSIWLFGGVAIAYQGLPARALDLAQFIFCLVSAVFGSAADTFMLMCRRLGIWLGILHVGSALLGSGLRAWFLYSLKPSTTDVLAFNASVTLSAATIALEYGFICCFALAVWKFADVTYGGPSKPRTGSRLASHTRKRVSTQSRYPVFCRVMFIGSLVVCVVQVVAVLPLVMALAARNELTPPLLALVLNGVAKLMFGILGNSLLLIRNRAGIFVGAIYLACVAISIGMVNIQPLKAPGDHLVILVVLLILRLALFACYVLALVYFVRWLVFSKPLLELTQE